MKTEHTRLPSFQSGVYQVWRRNFLQFKRTWLLNVFWIVLEPLLALLGIGYGLGSFISSMKGVSYLEFFFPALLCISSMMIAFFEGAYGNFAKLTHQKTYSTMILTCLDPRQVVLGEIFWAASKGTISSLAVGLIAAAFGHVENVMFFPAILVIFISSFLFGALGMLVTSMVKNYDGIILPTSGFIVPMSLFCGTYFPLDQLPIALKYAVYLFPLTHSVILVRELLLNELTVISGLFHLVVLLAAAYFVTKLAIRKITQKLIQ
jgi:lipooligosaccharide transport system permease protein